MAIQVSTLQTEYALLKQDISDVSGSTFVAWCRYVQRFIYRKLVKEDPERFIATQNYTYSSGSQALPVDFRDIRELGTGLFKLDNGSLTTHQLPITNVGSKSAGFYISGDSIVFTGEGDNETYTLRYIPTITAIDDANDYFTTDTLITGTEIVPEEYMDYLLAALDVWYSIWDSDTPSEALSDQRFVRALNELLEEIRRSPSTTGILHPSTIF